MKKTGSRIKDRGSRSQERGFGNVRSFTQSPRLNPHCSQRGFSLITAIFLLVVIAALGSFAVTLSTDQNQSQTMDITGARGYQAALAGIEWAAYHVSQEPSNSPAAWAGCTSASAVSMGGGLAPFSVTVTCTATSLVEGATTLWVYDVSSVASTAGSPGAMNYVEQTATARLAK